MVVMISAKDSGRLGVYCQKPALRFPPARQPTQFPAIVCQEQWGKIISSFV
jgi:hypothetical protein